MEGSVLTVPKLLMILAVALAIVAATGVAIGQERKAAWFRKRQKYSFFLRRGIVGEVCHFGYPCTKEGVLVTAGMSVAIVAASYTILYVL